MHLRLLLLKVEQQEIDSVEIQRLGNCRQICQGREPISGFDLADCIRCATHGYRYLFLGKTELRALFKQRTGEDLLLRSGFAGRP